MPARSRASSAAFTGPIPKTSGSTPAAAREAIRASGSRPILSAARSSPIRAAAAPSFRGEALPAVTVPPSRKTGGSFESASIVVSGADALIALQLDPGDPDDLLVVAALRPGRGRLPVASQRELVLGGA